MLISSDSQTRYWALSAFIATAAPVQADDLTTMMRAGELGTVLAAEEFCGLTYDQAAIQVWITANVDPAAMNFASMLSTSTMGSEFSQKDMSASAKTAHCAAVAQTAIHYGFTK